MCVNLQTGRESRAAAPGRVGGVSVRALVMCLVLAGSVALVVQHVAHAATPSPMQALVDQGKYWQAHGRGDLAEQAWEKVLRIDPKQPDALFGMGMVMADRKDGGARSSTWRGCARSRPTTPGSTNSAVAWARRARVTRP